MAQNYRRISLLSILNKIFEKFIHRSLYGFLQKYNILCKFQFGFHEGHSTTLANIEIVKNIREEILEGNFVLGAYLDLSKVFDTIRHETLLYKLEHVGVRGLPLNWFKSYLTNRKQCVQVNGADSSLRNMTWISVRTTSFLIYMNDISEIANNYKICLLEIPYFLTWVLTGLYTFWRGLWTFVCFCGHIPSGTFRNTSQ